MPWDAHAPADALSAFHRLHGQRYGFSDAARAVEIVNLRLRMVAAAEPYVPTPRAMVAGRGSAACYAERDVSLDGTFQPTRFYRRDALCPGDVIEGPAMITEYTSATALPPGCSAQVDGLTNLVITIGDEVQA